MMVIEAEYEGKEGFQLSLFLRPMFSNFHSFITWKQDEMLPDSTEAFRKEFVWREEINKLFETNLEGLMDVFMTHSQESGFTIDSAHKILKGIGSLLNERTVQKQFDLAQMTVIDED